MKTIKPNQGDVVIWPNGIEMNYDAVSEGVITMPPKNDTQSGTSVQRRLSTSRVGTARHSGGQAMSEPEVWVRRRTDNGSLEVQLCLRTFEGPWVDWMDDSIPEEVLAWLGMEVLEFPRTKFGPVRLKTPTASGMQPKYRELAVAPSADDLPVDEWRDAYDDLITLVNAVEAWPDNPWIPGAMFTPELIAIVAKYRKDGTDG